MQKRHFETIAATIRDMDLSDKVRLYVAKEFADALRETNPKFDRDRFIAACS